MVEGLYACTFRSDTSLFDVTIAVRRIVDSTIAVVEIMSKGAFATSSLTANIPIAETNVAASTLSNTRPALADLNRFFALTNDSGRPR